MKKILLVSGCSFTDKNAVYSTSHPEMDCTWPKWPELLANKLNMECINLGFVGSGVEYIHNSLIERILRLNKDRIGLVVSAWSESIRRDWEIQGKKQNSRIDNKGDIFYFIKRALSYYYSFQTFCENIKIPYKQVQMLRIIPNNKSWNINEETHILASKYIAKNVLFKNINKKNFIGWPLDKKLNGYSVQDILEKNIDKYCISKYDKHPNADGHKKIMELIYENL